MPLDENAVLQSLRSVMDPDLHRDIVTLGFVKDLRIEEGRGAFKIELTTPACPVKDLLQQQAEDAVRALEGVQSVEVEMTASTRTRSAPPANLLPGVRHCIAVASGKGGVGKSTVTVNLAVALAQTGARVGLLDADVYGPSIPLMMGCADERPQTRAEKILPIHRHGVAMMSLGCLLEEGQAVLWRGPMVAGTVKQLLEDVDWGELDYLLVDLPPGTGDAPMSLAQLAPLSGVVIVTTPHNVAANIAGKSVQLFRRLNTPILGVIENMGAMIDPVSGQEIRIFSGLSGEDLARMLETPYLGSVPLDPAVSRAGGEGVPSLLAYPELAQAKAFRDIAGRVARETSILAVRREETSAEKQATPN